MESQDVSIESVFNPPIADNESGVDQAAGNGFGIGFLADSRALDELDSVALGILHPKAAASIRPALDGLRHRHSLFLQIALERRDVVGRKRHVVHTIEGLRVGGSTEPHPLLADRVPQGLSQALPA